MKGNHHGGEEALSDRVLTVPNGLTAMRMLAVPVVVVLLLHEEDAPAVVIFVLAAATDFLDGRLARRKGGAGTSRLGTVLDPAADRLMLSGVAIVLALRDLLPSWVVAVLVGRDVLALLGSLLFGGKIRVNKTGKAATAVLMASVAVIMYRSGTSLVGEIMFYSGLGLSLFAGALYLGAVRRQLGDDAPSGGGR